MAKSRKPFIGVDLGGTSMRAAVVGADGTVLAFAKRKTHPELGAAGVVARLAETIQKAIHLGHLRAKDVGGIGVGVPGPVDSERGVVRVAVNLGKDWANLPLADELQKLVGLPAYIDNDVRVGAMGEHAHGSGKGLDDMVAIFVGTGIGGGLVLDGKLRSGFRGAAGEVGHTVVADGNGIIGKTGQPGTVEPLASRTGMERMVQELVAQGRETVIPALMQSVGGGRMTSSVMYQALHQNDAVMHEVMAVAQHNLGLLTGNLINIIDPQMVVFGGGVTARLGERFIAPIRRVAYANLVAKRDARQVRIVAGALKDDAGVVGAAVLARKNAG